VAFWAGPDRLYMVVHVLLFGAWAQCVCEIGGQMSTECTLVPEV
jgi:hypothetical protein